MEANDAERQLLEAVGELAERTTGDNFSRDLYRTLANRRWRRDGDPPASVALSWARTEQVVNRLRERRGEEPLVLAQTGGEGRQAGEISDELERRGWRSEPLETGSHQEDHVAEPPSAPPSKQGEREAPTEPPREWREAAAEAARRR